VTRGTWRGIVGLRREKEALMRGGLFIVAATVALLAAPTAYALLGQHGVKTTRLYEQLPAAATDGSTNYFAWAQNSRSRPNHFDAFLTRTGQPRVKLNSRGEGYVGGIDPPKVAYQQVVNGQSDVKIYDADQQTRPALPNGVNTATGNGSRASRATGCSSAARRATRSS
jgi:hypothetical protein